MSIFMTGLATVTLALWARDLITILFLLTIKLCFIHLYLTDFPNTSIEPVYLDLLSEEHKKSPSIGAFCRCLYILYRCFLSISNYQLRLVYLDVITVSDFPLFFSHSKVCLASSILIFPRHLPVLYKPVLSIIR